MDDRLRRGLQHAGPWVSRLCLSLGALEFGATGVAYFQEPVLMAWNHDIGMWSAAAKTVTRVQFGALPLSIACVCLFCLIAPQRFLQGLGLLCFLSLTSLAAYGYGLGLDGFHARSAMLFERQAFVALAYSIGAAVEWFRRRMAVLAPEISPMPAVATP